MTIMRILLLEDNPAQAEMMREEFVRCLRLKKGELLYIRTEAEFVSRIDEIVRFRPNFTVLDVMVIWSLPSPDAPERPAKVKQEGYYVAGVRCAVALRTALPGTRMVFYTIVDSVELESYVRERAESVADVPIISKGPDLGELVDKIRAITLA